MKQTANVLSAVILALAFIVGCSSGVKDQRVQTIIDQGKKPNDTPTPAIIADVLVEQQGVDKSLNDPKTGAKVTVEGMGKNDPDFEVKKGHAVAKIDEASTHNNAAMSKATTAHESSTKDVQEKATLAKQVRKYKDADPVLAWIELIAVVCIAVGGAGIIGSLFLKSVIPVDIVPTVRSAGFALVAYGIFMATLAQWLDTLRDITIALIIGALVIGLVWAIGWAIRNRKRLFESAESLELMKLGGQVKFTPDAKDAVKSLGRAWKSDDTEAAVQRIQSKVRQRLAPKTPHHILPATSAETPSNITTTAPAAPPAV